MAMEETLALEEAVEVAMSLTKREETLTIVTADHSHAVNIDEIIARFMIMILKSGSYPQKF